jgi:hypothetical protein
MSATARRCCIIEYVNARQHITCHLGANGQADTDKRQELETARMPLWMVQAKRTALK